jgi:hypothetical protein
VDKKLLTTDWGIKRYQHGCVNNFIWIYHLFFVSLRAGWVAEYYYDRESGGIPAEVPFGFCSRIRKNEACVAPERSK